MDNPVRTIMVNLLLVVGSICLLTLSGCGDTNVFDGLSDDATPQAQISTAVDSINSGDYAAAAAILETLDTTDPEVKKYLASAYIGMTGFDTLKLVEAMGDDIQNQSTTDGGVFSTVNELLGFENGQIDPAELQTKIDTAAKALDLLAPVGVDPATLSEEQKFQAGLYGAVEALYITEKILEGNDPLVLTDPTYAGTDTISGLVTQNFAANQDDLNRSLDLVVMASDALIAELTDPSQTNDVQQSLDEFLVDVGYFDNATDRNVVGVTSDKLATYIENQSI